MSKHSPEYQALDATGRTFAIVAARFNGEYVRRLVEGALATLREHGAVASEADVTWVPGALELPLAAQWQAERGVDAVLAFGVVLRGATEHFRVVTDVTSHGLGRVALDTGVPVLHGVIAADHPEQIEERTGGHHGHLGHAVARAAISMASLRPTRGTRA